MKSNLLSLITIEFQKFLSSFRGKKRASRTPTLYFAGLMALLLVAISCGYSYLIINPYVKFGLDTTSAVTFFVGIVSMLIFMSTMSQVRGIYIGEDYDVLSAMPIKKRDIVASKIIALYAVELSFSLLILIPHGVMQIILANNLSCFFISLLLAFTLPIVPLAMAVLISFIITVSTARFKGANYIFTGLYSIVIIGIVAISMFVNNAKDEAANSFNSIGGILKWINPSYILVENAIIAEKIYFLYYALINVVVAILSIVFLAVFFDRLHDIVSSVSMKEKYVRKDLKVKNPERILLGLEFKRLVNSKFYFVNTIMGSIMCIMGSIVFIVSFGSAKNSAPIESQGAMELLALPIFIACAVFIVGLVNPTTGSINIEGKNFWLTKTLPVDYKKYMRNKLIFAFVLTIPAVLIASIVAVCFFHDDIVGIIFAFILPISYVVLNSLIGLIVAIRHPKLKWSNEAEAVKNSASVFISLLIHFGLAVVLSAGMIVLAIFVPSLGFLSYVVPTSAVIIGIILCYLYLNKNFSRIVSEMEC